MTLDEDDYRLITGNEGRVVTLDYICSQRTKHGMMPAYHAFVKTIATLDLAE